MGWVQAARAIYWLVVHLLVGSNSHNFHTHMMHCQELTTTPNTQNVNLKQYHQAPSKYMTKEVICYR